MGPRQFIWAIFFTLTVVGYSQGQELHCEFSANCDTDITKAVINCVRNFGDSTAPGVCKCDGDDCDKIQNIDAETFTDVNLQKCKDWCTSIEDAANTDLNCKFWKFVHTAGNTKCFLMDKTGCQTQTEPTEECDHTPDNGDANFPHCQSGYLEREPSCPEENKPTDPPPPVTCPGPIITATDPDDTTEFYQKWICFQLDAEGGIIEMDMYDSVSTMPVGGFCKLDIADGSCRKLDITYRYTCGTTGKWEKSDGVDANDDEGYDSNLNQLKDLQCAAADLAGIPDEDGRELHCINGDMTAAGVIPSENSCLMTCDGYSVLSVFTDWKKNVEGGRSWFYTISGTESEPTELTDGSILKCWGRR